MNYNYMEALEEDIKEYIKENEINIEETSQDELFDTLFIEDSVTGNGSGSYTFNTYQAEENISHNMDLVQEACNEYGYTIDFDNHGAEYYDVTVRCYLLGQAIVNVYRELED